MANKIRKNQGNFRIELQAGSLVVVPSTNDGLIIDGEGTSAPLNVVFRNRAVSGNWGRGLRLLDSSDNLQGMFGWYGTGGTIDRAYIGFGSSPWAASGLGVAVLADGRVGIGTAAPTAGYALDINGASRTNGTSLIRGRIDLQNGADEIPNVGSDATIYRTNTDSGSFPFDGFGNLVLSARYNASRSIVMMAGDPPIPRMVIRGGGQVGVGTDNPGTRLDVAGSTHIRGASTSEVFTSPGQLAVKNSNNIPTVSFHGDDGTRAGRILFRTGSTSIIETTVNRALEFGTNSTQRMIITNTGVVNIAQTLRVRAGTTDSYTNPGPIALKQAGGTPYLSFHDDDGSRIGFLQMQGAAPTALWVEQNQDLRIGTNSLERMRIKSGGAIGFNTTQPASYVHINHNQDSGGSNPLSSYALLISRSQDESDSHIGLAFRTSVALGDDRTPGAAITHKRTGANSTGTLSFWTNPTTTGTGALEERMTILANGNVGIGTDNPNRRLVVNSDEPNATAEVMILGNSGNVVGSVVRMALQTSSDGNERRRAAISADRDLPDNSGYIAFSTRSNGFLFERMRISSTGNVGIGTNSPTAALDIQSGLEARVSLYSAGQDAGANFSTIGPNSANLVLTAHKDFGVGVYDASTISSNKHLAISTGSSNNLALRPADTAGAVVVGGFNPANASISFEVAGIRAMMMPRLTNTQRNALTPANGMVIYNTTEGVFQGYAAGVWTDLDPEGLDVSSIEIAASQVTSGTFTDARIPNLAASKITSGTFTDARIPNLAASKITSGTFANARISQSSVLQWQGALQIARAQTNHTAGYLDVSNSGALEDLLVPSFMSIIKLDITSGSANIRSIIKDFTIPDVIILLNIGTSDILISDETTAGMPGGTTPEYRLLIRNTIGDFIPPRGTMKLWYDSAVMRWRQID